MFPSTIRAALSLLIPVLGLAAGAPAATICCPPDLNSNGSVGSEDLAILLGQWGGPGTADLDGTGTVGPGDLSMLLGGWGPCPGNCTTTLLVGTVALGSGVPVASATVTSEFGGSDQTDATGAFSFTVEIPSGETSVAVTATATIDGSERTGSREASPVVIGGETAVGTITLETGGRCEPGWIAAFGGLPGVTGGAVEAFEVFEVGGVPKLFMGGAFTSVAGVEANAIASWDGVRWSPLGCGVTQFGGCVGAGLVRALKVFDDGGGPDLYAAGSFAAAGGTSAGGIARWDGQAWSALGPQAFNGTISALEVFNDGTGPALYAAGQFTSVGGIATGGIARWNGSTWSPVGGGLGDGFGGMPTVNALEVFDDGSGPALYAGGSFLEAGGTAVSNVARWNGSAWSSPGTGVNDVVNAMVVYGEAAGPALVVGGAMTSAGDVDVNHLARWRGGSWSGVGGGVNFNGVFSLAVADLGSGPVLHVGGTFTSAGGVAANRVARWNGSSWSSLGTGLNNSSTTQYPRAMAAFDAGSGPRLFVGGTFEQAGGLFSFNLATWDGSAWSPPAGGLTGTVHAIVHGDAGDGPATYIAHTVRFLSAQSTFINVFRVSRRTGSQWVPLGGLFSQTPRSLAIYDSGSGPRLHVAGDFSSVGGIDASRIARWSGTAWQPLGSGLGSSGYAMAVHDDGSGAKLYVGGAFTTAGGVTANRIARWNGSAWSAVGSGMNSFVFALAVLPGSGGSSLVAGGAFTTADGVTANRIARWNGSAWSPLGSGMNNQVNALVTWNSPTGAELVAGGSFPAAGGVSVNGIARWNGSSWSGFGAGLATPVTSLASVDFGQGAVLFAGGSFEQVFGTPGLRNIASWDTAASAWRSMGGGVASTVNALCPTGSGPTASLLVGGPYATPSGDSYIARWGCPLPASDEGDGKGGRR